MTTEQTPRRWFSRFNSLGFLILGALFLLLPFGAVSCETNGPSGAGTAHVSATGFQLTTADATTDATGVFAGDGDDERAARLVNGVESDLTDHGDLRWTAVLTALTAAAGLIASLALARRGRAQRLTAAALGLLGVALVAFLGIRLLSRWTDAVRDIAKFLVYLPEGEGQGLPGRAGETVALDLGFWISLAGFAAILLLNTVAIFRGRAPATVPPPPKAA